MSEHNIETARPDIAEKIDGMLVEVFALTQHLAEQSRDATGSIVCCVCGSSHQLVCVGRGWGGVYACRTCEAEVTR